MALNPGKTRQDQKEIIEKVQLLIDHIPSLNLDEGSRSQIASFVAYRASKALLEKKNLKNFNLSNQSRLNLAISYINKNPRLEPDKLTDIFELEQAELLQLAEYLAKAFSPFLPRAIQHFNLPEEKRIEFAEKYAGKSRDLAENIDQFQISDEKVRLRLAEKSVSHGLAFHFDKFHTTDEKSRIRLAEMCHPSDLPPHFDKFHITDEAIRISFAEKSVRFGLAPFMSLFHITCESVRIRLAEKCIEYDLAAHIDQFQISDEKVRVALAEKCVEFGLAAYIEKFQISDEKERIRLLHLCAQSCKYHHHTKDLGSTDSELGFFKNIQNFQLSEKVLLEVAEKYFLTAPWLLVRYCEQCHFSEDILMQIIKKSLVTSIHLNQDLLEIMDQFKSLSEKARTEIALFCVKRCNEYNIHWFANLFLKKFHIQGEQNQEAVLRRCMRLNSEQLVSFSILFSSKEDQDQAEMATRVVLNCLFSEASNQLHLFNRLSVLNLSNRLRQKSICLAQDLFKSWDFNFLTKQYETIFRTYISIAGLTEYEPLFEQVNQIENPYKRKETLYWLAATLFTLREKLKDEKLREVAKLGFLEKICQIPDPNTHYPLVLALVDAANAGKLPSSRLAKKEKLVKERLTLLSPFYPALEKQGVVPSVLENFAKRVHSRYFLQNTPHFSFVVQALSLISHECELSPQEKTQLIQKICDRSNRKDNHSLLKVLTSVITILEFKDSRFLKRMDSPFENIVEEVFKIHIPIGNIPDFAEKYQNTFGSNLRIKHALMTYAAKMRLAGQSCLECLGRFADSVIRDEFTQIRYARENHPHLMKIPDSLLEKWKEDNTHLSGAWIAVDTDNPYDLLLSGTEVMGSCQRVNGDPEKNKGLLGYLMNGQTRLVAVKDNSGKILSRAIMRLLLDDEDNGVIFLEKPYPDPLPEKHQEAILRVAQDKARKMHIPLTASEWKGEYEKYPHSLHSFGGPAPYEYCDAAQTRGVQNNSVFTIPQAYRMM
jgi:hypothetical protein